MEGMVKRGSSEWEGMTLGGRGRAGLDVMREGEGRAWCNAEGGGQGMVQSGREGVGRA